MEVLVLASGSSGNSALVCFNETSILIDAGVSATQIRRRLAHFGRSIDEVDAILVSHEHSDHVRGLEVLVKRDPTPVWATAGTWSKLSARTSGGGELSSGKELLIGGVSVLPVATSHDAREPVCFVFTDGRRRVGVVTDTGVFTPLLEQRLAGCDWLLVETNHDADLLRHGPYPWPLKQRIASRHGHLGNHQTAEALDRLSMPDVRILVGLHLSAENNRVDLAEQALAETVSETVPVHAVTRSDMLRVAALDGDLRVETHPVPLSTRRKR
ncbi:MAG: MBL fold metallo-hydrolase [bacterium]|nr:MBL fold metallo-hydrolase [bacterium]